MAVYLYCYNCRASFKIDLKSCPKCNQPVDQKKKCFRIQLMVNKKMVVKLVPGTLTLAREVEAKTRAKLIEGIYKDPRAKEPTLNEVWTEYFAAYKARGKAWHKEETRYNKNLGPKFGDKSLKSITPFMIEKFMIELKETETRYHRPYSPKSIKNAIDLLSLLFNYARRLGMYAGENPCERVSKPKINNVVMNILPVEKIRELLKYLETYQHRTTANLINFLFFTGCRLGEALKLDFGDINFDNRMVLLRDPKGGKDQHIYLNDGALAALLEQRKNKKNDCEIVFPRDDGRRHNKISPERWSTLKKLVGIPEKFRCHDLRHQFASLLASSGEVDPYTLQNLLTHADFETTQRYAHLFPRSMRKGVALLDKIISEAPTPEPDPDNIIKLA